MPVNIQKVKWYFNDVQMMLSCIYIIHIFTFSSSTHHYLLAIEMARIKNQIKIPNKVHTLLWRLKLCTSNIHSNFKNFVFISFIFALLLIQKALLFKWKKISWRHFIICILYTFIHNVCETHSAGNENTNNRKATGRNQSRKFRVRKRTTRERERRSWTVFALILHISLSNVLFHEYNFSGKLIFYLSYCLCFNHNTNNFKKAPSQTEKNSPKIRRKKKKRHSNNNDKEE